MDLTISVLCVAFAAGAGQGPGDEPAGLRAEKKIELPGHKAAVTRVVLFERKNWLVSSDEKGSVFIWDLNRREPPPQVVTTFGAGVPVWALACRSGDPLIAAAATHRWGARWRLLRPDISLVDPLTNLKDFEWHDWANCLAFSPGAPCYMVVGSVKGPVRIATIAAQPNLDEKGKPTIGFIEGRSGAGRSAVTAVAFAPTPGTPLVATGTDRGDLQLFRVVTEPTLGLDEMPSNIAGPSQQISGLRFSPDGLKLLISSYDGTIVLWEIETGRKVWTIQGPSCEVNYTHTGVNGEAKVQGLSSRVNYVDFSPDVERFASAHDDGGARIWDAETGEEQLKIQAHGQPALCVMLPRTEGD